MVSYLRHLRGSIRNQSVVSKSDPGKTIELAQCHKTEPMTVPTLRALMENVCQSEAHLRTLRPSQE